MDNKMLEDINGKMSSKRVWANRFLSIGLIMAVIWFMVALGSVFMRKEFNIKFPYEMWYGLIGFGAAALGMTVFEEKVK